MLLVTPSDVQYTCSFYPACSAKLTNYPPPDLLHLGHIQAKEKWKINQREKGEHIACVAAREAMCKAKEVRMPEFL